MEWHDNDIHGRARAIAPHSPYDTPAFTTEQHLGFGVYRVLDYPGMHEEALGNMYARLQQRAYGKFDV